MRLGCVSLGLLRRRWLVNGLAALGHDLVPWHPRARVDAIVVWGRGAAAQRGAGVARARGLPVWTLEDPFLRSLRPNDPRPAGLILDRTGIHFETGLPSDLAAMLSEAAPAPPEAAGALDLLRAYALSKYNHWRAARPGDLPEGPFVLVCDQRRDDASIAGAGAGPATFRRMLEAACDENPGLPVVLRAHPRDRGHFAVLPERVTRLTAPLSPQTCLAAAARVYTVSSQIGMEAILAGHRPRVFGRAFYTGLGLTEDDSPWPTPRAALSAEQLFAVTHLRYCHWFDPMSGAPCPIERAIACLDGPARAARATSGPMVAGGMSRWKRPRIARFLATGGGPVRFTEDSDRATVVWATRGERAPAAIARMEDGFIRSDGLGAKLVPPLSVVIDPTGGMHYDATRASALEGHIKAARALPPAALARARALRAQVIAAGVSKYQTGAGPAAQGGRPGGLVLVPGQVADDASLRFGGSEVRDNLALLKAARAQFPQAQIVYRTHPDVRAGLRKGALDTAEILRWADGLVDDEPLGALWPRLARVVTMTSTLGFEALLRGIPVTCFGWPFYAGWGLTEDLGPPGPEARRGGAPVSLDALTHAVLIDYPLYLDPVTQLACAPEVTVERLAQGARDRGATARLRLLSAAQSLVSPLRR